MEIRFSGMGDHTAKQIQTRIITNLFSGETAQFVRICVKKRRLSGPLWGAQPDLREVSEEPLLP